MIRDNRSNWSKLKTQNVTVSVRPKRVRQQLVFRVAQVIDCGIGRPKITLECLAFGGPGRIADALDVGFEAPDTLEHLDLIYTRLDEAKRLLPYQRIENLYESAQIEEIVPDVLRSGDVIVMSAAQEGGGYSAASSRPLCRVYRVMEKRRMAAAQDWSLNAL